MGERAPLRLAAFAAIAGGLLRALAVLLPISDMSQQSLQQFYFVTDFLLLLGVFGLYARNSAKLDLVGAACLSIFVFGILVVRSPHVTLFGAGGYQAGAAIALLGIVGLGTMMLSRGIAHLAPILWFLALAAGLSAAMGFQAGPATAIAGLLFGAGFVAAGAGSLRAA
jgi:hypothetical protein